MYNRNYGNNGDGNDGNGGNTGSGVDKPDKFIYFYHPDHLGSSSYITDVLGEVVQHIEYFAFGETFLEEHSNTDRTPYLFNGKELDEETGLYYYGARYYNPRVSLWLNVDPLAEKYPFASPYNYVLNNPIRLIDPNGKDPVTGIFEAISSFVLSAGMDFLTSWIIEGNTVDESLNDIGWIEAGWDATKSYMLASVTPPGTATARKIAKLANSTVGKLTIGIMEEMTTSFMDNYIKGNYDDSDGNFDFNKVNMSELFWEATIETLVDQGLGSRADKLLATLKKENKSLYQKLSKLEKKIANGESNKRISNYAKKTLKQADKSNEATINSIKTKTIEKVIKETSSKGLNEKRKDINGQD